MKKAPGLVEPLEFIFTSLNRCNSKALSKGNAFFIWQRLFSYVIKYRNHPVRAGAALFFPVDIIRILFYRSGRTRSAYYIFNELSAVFLSQMML
ncbi:hypothetical protein QML58_19650 [Providencia rettgeri]|nr:hypothetical protein [Providencia stuartii]MDI7245583.1 hypothetical protein [Providencia rettgeri]